MYITFEVFICKFVYNSKRLLKLKCDLSLLEFKYYCFNDFNRLSEPNKQDIYTRTIWILTDKVFNLILFEAGSFKVNAHSSGPRVYKYETAKIKIQSYAVRSTECW